MTKQEFMSQFLNHFSDLSPEEKEQITDYFQELICDGLEQGKTEEECVAAFGDPAEAAARFRQESGLEEPANQTSGGKGAIQSYQANGSIHTVDLKAENLAVEIRPVLEPGTPIRVLFSPVEGRDEIEFREQDGVFYFRHKMKKKVFSLSFIFKESTQLIVEVPTAFEGSLRIQNSNGRINMTGLQKLYQTTLITSNAPIHVEDASSTHLSLKAGNAALVVQNIGTMELEAVTSNGRIDANSINCNTARFVSSNGSIRMEGVNGEKLTAGTSNGSIRTWGCKGTKEISLSSSNGGIHFENCQTPDMRASTSNSSVKGTIVGDIREYAIESRTSNGSNNLPNIRYPDCTKNLSVKTSNGRIDVQFIMQPENH